MASKRNLSPLLKTFALGAVLAVAGLVLYTQLLARPAADDLPAVTVYKSPTCGCCSKWNEHLEANGFEVKAIDMPDVRPMKEQLGVPAELASCHTAVVGGYVVEGHVPAEDVKRLLAERPDVTGLAVPGMPIGSPGMEVEGRPAEAYDVVAFTKGGEQTVFAHHGS